MKNKVIIRGICGYTMTARRTSESVEYQEGNVAAITVIEDDSGTTELHNPHIAGTTEWHRWGVGWDDGWNTIREKKVPK